MVRMRLSTDNILTSKPENKNPKTGHWLRFGAIGIAMLVPAAVVAREPPSAAVVITDSNAVMEKLERGVPVALAKKIIELGAQKKIPEINKQLKRLVVCTGSFTILSNEDIAHAFVQNPKRITDALERLVKYVRLNGQDQRAVDTTLSILYDNVVGRLFAKHPHSFISIALSARSYAWMAFDVLSNETLSALFDRHPQAFVAIARGARTNAYSEFELLHDERIRNTFLASPQAYAAIYQYDDARRNEILLTIRTGTTTLAQTVILSISQYDHVAVELGRPIDDLKTEAEQRESIRTLQNEEVVGLLCSNPELFSRSTNRLLFERLRTITGDKCGPEQVRKQFGLNQTQLRNIMFRAVNHGRLSDFISAENREDDTRVLSEILLGNQHLKTGIYSDTFDERYFYMLANSIENASIPLAGLGDSLTARRTEMQSREGNSDEEKIVAALDYLIGIVTKDRQWVEATNFDYDYYRGADKKLTVIQVFDRRDTAGFHWNYTTAKARQKYGQPTTDPNGAVIYEDRNSRMVLFMGKTAEENAGFTKNWIATHERGIVTFRGDSVHLAENMPDDIFGNRKGRYVFMIGSCGSAASAPGYIQANPNSEIRTISYMSTGRGVVTNVILFALLEQKKSIRFDEFIVAKSAQIVAAGGEPDLIRVWTRGEGLLAYLTQRTKTSAL